MKLEPGKFYATRSGSLVRILMHDGDEMWIGALYEEGQDFFPSRWEAFKWRSGGFFLPDGCRAALDLVEMISTSNVFPPIPIRTCDWIASYSNDDGEPCGYGRTEVEAAIDLVTNHPREERERAA